MEELWLYINSGYCLSSYCGACYCYELSWSIDCQDLGHLWELWAALFYSTVHMYIKLYCCVYLLGWFLITGTCDQLVEVITYTSGCAYNQVPYFITFSLTTSQINIHEPKYMFKVFNRYTRTLEKLSDVFTVDLNMLNLFKVDNKDARTTSKKRTVAVLFVLLLCWTGLISRVGLSVFISMSVNYFAPEMTCLKLTLYFLNWTEGKFRIK